ncbi:MAG TPA: replication initiator protein A [Rhabdaerophilum sp.]|nr:replication initiator protein A [Rhabdaerophilum sp.]
MGKPLPDRHPNRDFFIVDISDAAPKDDMASMEHPVFSLSVKPDMRHLTYRSSQGQSLTVVPSGLGLATIMDKDVLLYCISKLVAEKNAGRAISPWVEVTAHEIMAATNWQTNDDSYKRFENALLRLKGTTLKTDIRTGGHVETRIFGLIDEAEILRRTETGEPSPFGRLAKVRIKLSDWTFRAVEAMEVLSIDRGYFRLRRPLERRLYEIARKHVGTKNQSWTIGIEKLRDKVGTNAPLKKFRFNLKEIIAAGHVPEYGFALDGDKVVMQRLTPAIDEPADWIKIRPDTLDKAQKIAARLGLSVFDLEREWNEWAKAKGEKINAPDGAFLAFCQQKESTPHARRYVEARVQESEAKQLGLALPELARGQKR